MNDNDLISRSELLKAFEEKCATECSCCEYYREFRYSSPYQDHCGLIEDAPSVSRKKGKWIAKRSWSEGFGMGENYGFYYECSECHKEVKGGYPECKDNYCPNCGAEMEE